MFKVKSFAIDIQPFKTTRALNELDKIINDFFSSNAVKKVISISDTPTTDNKGETISIIRLIVYEE
jgi:hypothetical protein